MSNLIKKGLAIFLSITLLSTNLFAGWKDDIIGTSLTNFTEGKATVIKDSNGNTVRNIIASPSLSFKFGPAFETPEPWFSFSPPSLSAGCNGLSMKGMFGSIIGADRLKQQLANAGSSLAWGIVVGLIYSLPGIGNAFKMINNWAKQIQKLLAASCQAGIALGQKWGERLNTDDDGNKILDFKENETLEKLSKYNIYDEVSGYLGETFEVDDPHTPTMSETVKLYTGVFMAPLVQSSPISLAFKKILDASSNNMSTLTSAMTGGDNSAFKESKFAITFDNCGEYGSKVDSSITCLDYDTLAANLNDSSFSQKTKLYQAMIQLTIMHSAANVNKVETDGLKAFKKIGEAVKNKIENVRSGGTIPSDEETGSTIFEYVTKDGKYPSLGFTSSSGEKITGDNIAEFFNDYFTFGYSIEEFPQPKVVEFIIYSINTTKIGSNDVIYFILPYSSESGASVNFFKTNLNNKGVKELSDDLIDKLMTKGADIENIINSSPIPLLVPDLLKFINVLQKTNKNNEAKIIEKIKSYNFNSIINVMLEPLSGVQSFSSSSNGYLMEGSNTYAVLDADLLQHANDTRKYSGDSLKFQSDIESINTTFNKVSTLLKSLKLDVSEEKLEETYKELLELINKKTVKHNETNRK
jgi:hypothetical protein